MYIIKREAACLDSPHYYAGDCGEKCASFTSDADSEGVVRFTSFEEAEAVKDNLPQAGSVYTVVSD